MSLTVKKIFLATVALNCICATAYVIFFLTIKRSSEQTLVALADMERREQQRGRLAAAKKTFAATTAAATTLASLGVESVEEQVGFISFLENLGREVGVSVAIKNPSIEKSDSPAGKDYFNLSLATAGSWTSVTHFLLLLEAIPMDIQIGGITLKSSSVFDADDREKSSRRGIWNAELQIKVTAFKGNQ